MNKILVVLKIYQGARLTKDALTDKVINQNQNISLFYDTKEWHNFIGKMYKNGFGTAQTLSAKTQIREAGKPTQYVDVAKDLIAKIDSEVQVKLKVDENKGLTKDQIELKKLKVQMAELLSGNKDDKGDELKALKATYKTLNPTGKGVSPAWSKEEIEEKIAGFEADLK